MNSAVSGGLVRLLFPTCNIPIYQMHDHSAVVSCRHYVGYTRALLVTVITAVVAGAYTYYVKSREEQDSTYTPLLSLYWMWGIVGGVALLSFVRFPFFSSYFDSNMFNTVQIQQQTYIKDSTSPLQADRMINDYYRSRITALAMDDVAVGVVGAGMANAALS
jgi:hypothetical protein